MDTDVPSNISFRGEVAFLKPDTPKADQFDGEATIYVDSNAVQQAIIEKYDEPEINVQNLAGCLAGSPPRLGHLHSTLGGNGLERGFRLVDADVHR